MKAISRLLEGREKTKMINDALTSVPEVVESRIFIEPAMDKLDVLKRWFAASDAYDENASQFNILVEKLLKDIRAEARKDIGF